MPYKCIVFAGQEDFLSNIVHLSNVGSMLGQRRKRWPNINTALDQCLVRVVSCNQFSGYINAFNLYSIHYLHDFAHKQDSQLNSSLLITVWRVVIEV